MRRSVAAALVRERLAPDDVVVVSLGSTNRAWREQKASQATYIASDPMGMAPSLALGLALARQDRRVVLLEGDGDLAMNLGVLVTIAGAAPRNLRVAVFANRRYETGGGQPLPADAALSFSALARGAGWPWAVEAPDEERARSAIDELLTRDGPGLVALRIDAEEFEYAPDPGARTQVEERAAFQERLRER
jgi:thiamine pyrophosphate-dependent acetolactate synthase large subunit-like protein